MRTDKTFNSDQIKLRKISSLDGSSLYKDTAEKRENLTDNKNFIPIPEYNKAKPYRNNTVRRLYSRLRYFGALLRQKLSGRDYPIIAVIVINNHCNWKCVYCFGDYPDRHDVDYTTDELKYLIDELYNMGIRYVNLHGGETLLRNDIGEISNHVKNKGMYLCLITNGSLFPDKLDDVKNADNVTISLDGSRENNDINRGEGSYDTALEAITHLKRQNIPVRVSATLTRSSMHDVEFLSKLAHEKNFNLFFSILFKPLKKAQHLQMSDDEIRAATKEIQRCKAMGYPVFTSEPVLQATYEWPFSFNEIHHVTEEEIPASYRPFHIPCYYSRTKFTIEADGYIYPCFLTTDGSFNPKNWKEVGVDKAIHHVQETNTCRACPAMSQNDHNLLLGLDARQVGYVIIDQIKETLGLKSKIK